ISVCAPSMTARTRSKLACPLRRSVMVSEPARTGAAGPRGGSRPAARAASWGAPEQPQHSRLSVSAIARRHTERTPARLFIASTILQIRIDRPRENAFGKDRARSAPILARGSYVLKEAWLREDGSGRGTGRHRGADDPWHLAADPEGHRPGRHHRRWWRRGRRVPPAPRPGSEPAPSVGRAHRGLRDRF